MKADQFFYMIRKEQREINILEELIEGKRYMLLPGAIRYDKDVVQTSPDDSLSRIMADIAVMETRVKKLLTDLLNRSAKAHELVDDLVDPYERQAMTLYYLTCDGKRLLTWDEVAAEMGYTDKQAKRIRNKALASIEANVRQTGMSFDDYVKCP